MRKKLDTLILTLSPNFSLLAIVLVFATQKSLFQELNEQYKLTGKEQITTIAEL